jgi:hypothetical protein
MTPPDFDNNDPDDFEDFLLINGSFDRNDSSDNDGDHNNNNNAGCGTMILLVIMVLLLSGYLSMV